MHLYHPKKQSCTMCLCNTKSICPGVTQNLPPLGGSLLSRESARHPIQALIKTITGGCTSRLDEPLSVSHVVQSKLLSDLSCWHRIWQVLLVCEHKECSITHLIFIQHLVHLLLGILDTVTVVAVNNKDQALSVLVVVPPQRADFVLTTHIPDCEADVLILDSLHVEANCRNGW